MAPPLARGKDGKLIQIIKVICCYSLLSTPGAGAFSRDFTINLASQCRALKIEKLNAPLFPGPEGVGDTNDWCIINRYILC